MTVKQTYCTNCRMNVDLVDSKYVRLANKRAIIEGQCSQCGSRLMKAKIMPHGIKAKRKEKRSLL